MAVPATVDAALPPADPALILLERECDTLRTRLDLVCRTTHDGLWEMAVPLRDATHDRNPAWLSDPLRHLLGVGDAPDRRDTLGSWSQRLHPEDRAATLDALALHLNDRTGRTPYDVTHRLRCGEGQYRWFRSRGQTLRDAQGMALRIAGAVTCVDEQRQREREWERTLVRLELSTELINDGLWDIGIEAGDPFHPANQVWWSPQMRAQLGFRDEHEFPNEMSSWASRLHPQDKDLAIEAFVRHLADRSGATP